jgi:hypothetical protein
MPIKSTYSRLLVGTSGAGGAWDFSSVSNSMEVSLQGNNLEDTRFQDTARTYVVGDVTGNITQNGYYDNTGANTFEQEIAESIANAETLYVAALLGTTSTPVVAYVSQQTNTENMAISTPVAELVTLNGSWGAGTGICRGLQVWGGTFSATGAQTGPGYVDFGAAGSAGGKAWLFVTTVTGTATNATITVESDDNTSFTSAATEGTFTFSGVGCYPITLSGTVDRYIRLNCTSKGGATSFVVRAICAISGITY